MTRESLWRTLINWWSRGQHEAQMSKMRNHAIGDAEFERAVLSLAGSPREAEEALRRLEHTVDATRRGSHARR